MRFRALFATGCIALLLCACAKDIPAFVPPDQRPQPAVDQAWRESHVLTIAYHDVADRDPDQTYLAVRTDKLIEQLAWLRHSGYEAVSVDQILEAKNGGKPLPPKAVLLTFDDGYSSFYTRVYPILKAYRWPAILAPVGAWVSTPLGEPVKYGDAIEPRAHFLNWDEIGEMSRSGLVEIASHTYDQHKGILANPQGNSEPAEATRRFDPKTGTYESEAAFDARIRNDAQLISAKIAAATGKPPRVWVWPYGAASGSAIRIISEDGYSMALTLEDGLGTVDQLMSFPRVLVSDDPAVSGYANAVRSAEAKSPIQVVHVDLDYVYDPDPVQVERNLGVLVERIATMKVSTVFLQAFADPEGDGLVRDVYFPNRWLPMRADLFNRVAWQLKSRAGVRVYAWMPVLSYEADASVDRVKRWDPQQSNQAATVDPRQYRRLSPFDPKARDLIVGLYEDLARYGTFDGILYHDDALLSDFEDAGPHALAAYRAAGLPGTIPELRANPDVMQAWTRFKSQYLIDFTKLLTQHVRAISGPQIKTARNIFAEPVLNPASEAWFAQNLDDFLSTYDWTAPMAMPLMENVPLAQSLPWLGKLVDTVAQRSGAMDKTVFELQSRDWSKPGAPPIDGAILTKWIEKLRLHGARSFGYYPDDFSNNQPELDAIRPAISGSWYPYKND
ncbi:poly-beta-1,6-N-acetyl-D-glucosamine N-deacetylase PgaB [Allopusillimonas ginsengisoli]|nr:poly-beta-1,6-N-acetyl-D-glucosamine N-deacetylase PgaB [Allopusillimonas ginsengisoli]